MIKTIKNTLVFKLFRYPFLIAFLFALIFYFIFTHNLLPFKISIEKSAASDNYIETYDDINNDGCKENIELFSSDSKYATINNCDGSIRYAVPFYCEDYIGFNQNITNDYNKNGIDELYVFTHSGDTVFLNIIELFEEKERAIASHKIIPLERFQFFNDKPDCLINNVYYDDLNQDAYQEIIFSLRAGFTVSPRKLYYYDIYNNTLKSTEDLGAACSISNLTDVNNDGKNEILLSCGDVNNMENPEAHFLPDSCTYFMILNDSLELLFPPISNHLDRAILSPRKTKDKNKMLILPHTRYPFSSEMLLYDISGSEPKLINSKSYENYVSWLYYFGECIPRKQLVLKDYKKICSINDDLSLNTLYKFNTDVRHLYMKNEHDFDNDGIRDSFFKSPNSLYLISIAKRKKLAEINNINWGNTAYQIHSYTTANQGETILLNVHFSNEKLMRFRIEENPLYAYRILFGIGSFIVLLLIFNLFDLMIKQRVKKSLEIRKKLQELQLLNSKSQISPHFLFNALNSISALIYKADKEKAYDYITRFSKLHRSLLENSDQVFIHLKDELDFLENYLLLQKLRYKERLEYNINCDEAVNKETSVPKMLIQGYVENAIKHGLSPKPEGGNLTIKITQKSDKLIIIIEDDGIGMEESAKIKNKTNSTGKGLRLNKQIFDLLEKLYNYKIKYRFENVNDHDAGNTGTKVVLELPG